jgi:large subunit ribosomal protein L9
MDVILLERIEKLGQMGDVVSVRPGYARNYLLPEKKALRATEKNKNYFETQRTQLETVNLEHKTEALSVAKKLEGHTVTIVRQASDNDQLYGSVTVKNIAQEITSDGFTVESKQVQLARPIKLIGIHRVNLRLHPEVHVAINVNVARSEEEALSQTDNQDLIDDTKNKEDSPVEESPIHTKEDTTNTEDTSIDIKEDPKEP